MGYWLLLAIIAVFSMAVPTAIPVLAWILGSISAASMLALLLYSLDPSNSTVVRPVLMDVKENPEMLTKSYYIAAGYAVFWVICTFALANPLLMIPTVLQFGNIVLFKILMD